MDRQHLLRLVAAPLILGLAACEGSDNPTALADLNPEIEFEIETSPVQTLEEVEFIVHAREGGMHMDLTDAEMEIETEASGDVRIVTMEPEGEEYAAHLTFFEPGEHRLRFRGTPRGHGLMGEFGGTVVNVMRRHEVVGPYWVEIETEPHGPLLEGATAHVRVYVFGLMADGTPGAPVEGLDVVFQVHTPDDGKAALAVAEREIGVYEAEYTFGDAGLYALQVGIDVGTGAADTEFRIPVFAPDGDPSDQPAGESRRH